MTVHELVHLASVKLSLPADRCWQMTVADLFLTLKPVEDKNQTATSAWEVTALCRQVEERLRLLAKLTLEQRVELERLKAQLC